jgi:hypothetical protein
MAKAIWAATSTVKQFPKAAAMVFATATCCVHFCAGSAA